MINNVIRGSFALIGAITGFTLTRTIFMVNDISFQTGIEFGIFFILSVICALLFYATANQIISAVLKLLDKIEATLQKMTIYEITVSSAGLIAGLIVANLINIPVNRIGIVGLPLSIISNILFACIGVGIALGKKHESFSDSAKGLSQKGAMELKMLDTNVIIDGRIVDICRSGFLEGQLVIPNFVLEELRHIADSPDGLKRNRGRRGLDVLNALQKELAFPVKIENFDDATGAEVDDRLLKAAKRTGCTIITNDYNLNKVANVHGVQVLNINELANAMKPIALPGEEMSIQIVKDGKENGQGIGYLDDGTMIVVEGGKRYMGELVSVMVTSVIQTAAGRMIFAKPKNVIERVI
ncbi:MAG: TRAM domain-containing protein [Clostridia bacterium]|nr:TRAM domain-containing protein [Clostridia bacterium]